MTAPSQSYQKSHSEGAIEGSPLCLPAKPVKWQL